MFPTSSAAHAAFTLPGTAHPQLTFLRAVTTTVRLPAEGMRTIQFGFQMHHGAGPIQALEQRLELLDPQAPLILDRTVTGAKVDHLGLVQAFSGLLATGKHLAPEKWPGLASRQLTQHLVVDLATQTALRRTIGWPVANAAINDGFGLHTSTPENQGCLLPQRRVPRKELLGKIVIFAGRLTVTWSGMARAAAHDPGQRR